MTIATTTFTRFDAIGVREELSNNISNIAPTETPFMSNAKIGKVANTLFEFQTDTLGAAVSSNYQLEGDTISAFTAVVPTVRMTNHCQISHKTGSVSGTVEVVKSAGGANDKAYVAAKISKELKRDMETMLLANLAAAAGNTTTARRSAGLMAWIKTNQNNGGGAAAAPSYTTLPNDVWTEPSGRAFTEVITKNVLQQCFTSGADTSTIMVGAWNKQAFSSFSGIAEVHYNATGKGQVAIIGAADTYRSDFGLLSVVPNRFQKQSVALFIDWDMVQVNYLRTFHTEDLAKRGDSKDFVIRAEYGLKVANEKGLGIAVGLTTS